MKNFRSGVALVSAMLLAAPTGMFAASHREAPITALDRAADITDFYAFVSYEDPTKVVFIMNVDPFLEPSNGPNYFPFDPNVVYTINIDNKASATPAVAFEFRFTTKINAPTVYTGFVGAGAGINAPANAPAGSAGTPVIPPAITSLTGAGAAGFNLMQTFTVNMLTGSGVPRRSDLTGGATLVAVPSNVGPRTMPNYTALAQQGIYSLANGVRVFAGTVDDPFYINLGATFDSANFPASSFQTGLTNGGIPIPVLSASQDGNDAQNSAVDNVSGYNVNTIAIEVPISMVAVAGQPIIGAWATTSRPSITVRPAANNVVSAGAFLSQVQRMGNPLINELIIGTGYKDMWSISKPANDSQFASYDLDPLFARALNAVFGAPVPDPPRNDLLPLVQYTGPFAVAGSTGGPIADLLRLNTSIPATPMASRKRLGLLAGDGAGFPNGRRITDDVTDIALRVVAGALCATCVSNGKPFAASSVPMLGDGVNTNDVATQEVFPYVAFAHGGTTALHQDPAATTQCSPNCPQ